MGKSDENKYGNAGLLLKVMLHEVNEPVEPGEYT